MKKRFVLISLLIIFLSITLALSVEEPKTTSAYTWLRTQTPPASDQLALKLLAFSYNASYYTSTHLDDSVINNVSSNGDVGNNILSTSYTILALNSIRQDTSKSEAWLLSQKITTKLSGMIWYLQLDTAADEDVTCTITDDNDIYMDNVTVLRNKKYETTGNCFSLENDYWLKIKDNCLDTAFTIYCDENTFYASLPYKIGDITYVPSDTITSSAPATVKIETFCMKVNGICDYESTLWAAYALKLARNSEFGKFAPYLLSESYADSTVRSSLLYLLNKPSAGSEDFANSILKNQSSNGYWPKSQTIDTPWDTAVASYALRNYLLAEENLTKARYYFNSTSGWSESWGVKSTALILYSLFSREQVSNCERYVPNAVCDFEAPSNDYVENDTFTCNSGKTCYALGSCKKADSKNVCSTDDLDQNYSVNNLICGAGSCWQPNECYKRKSIGLSCESACDVKIQFENSSWKNACNTGDVCCGKHDCALAGGECKSSGNPDEVENVTLTSVCQAGGANLKCFVPSPCAKKNLTCASSCPSGYKQKISSKYPESYKCGTGAVCCEIENPPACTDSCKPESECTDPYSVIGNFACLQDGTACCKLENTCSLNTAGGYSCKSLCGDNETQDSGLNCITGVCCKPALEKQCEAAGNKCRPGTAATSCLAGEKANGMGCPIGNSCCEKLPENSCENIYKYSCKGFCSATEEQLGLSFSCPTGICCKQKTAVVACSTLDDCYNKPECDKQTVTDIFGRTGKCEYGKEKSCDDNFDNDGNGLVDSEDPACPKSCSSQGFVCCDECQSGYEEMAFDDSCSPRLCCDQCKQETVNPPQQTTSSRWWLWVVLIVIVLGIAAAVYFLMQKKKGKRSGPGPLIPGFRPPVRPYSAPENRMAPTRPFQPSPQQIQLRPSEAKPKLSKTDKEMEETIKKIRSMSQ